MRLTIRTARRHCDCETSEQSIVLTGRSAGLFTVMATPVHCIASHARAGSSMALARRLWVLPHHKRPCGEEEKICLAKSTITLTRHRQYHRGNRITASKHLGFKICLGIHVLLFLPSSTHFLASACLPATARLPRCQSKMKKTPSLFAFFRSLSAGVAFKRRLLVQITVICGSFYVSEFRSSAT